MPKKKKTGGVILDKYDFLQLSELKISFDLETKSNRMGRDTVMARKTASMILGFGYFDINDQWVVTRISETKLFL